MKTVRPKFSELKMLAVFTRENKGLFRLFDRNFPQSYTTSRDKLVPVSAAANRIARGHRRLPKKSGNIYLPDARFVVQVASLVSFAKYEFKNHSYFRSIYNSFGSVCFFAVVLAGLHHFDALCIILNLFFCRNYPLTSFYQIESKRRQNNFYVIHETRGN